MIALLLPVAIAQATITAGPLGAIGRQALPASGCAAYLWTIGTERALVAMASADPAQLRVSVGGKTVDVARASQNGAGGFGFAATTEYRRDDVVATLSLTIATRADLTGGATVPEATLRIDLAGQDTVIVPVAGLIGCR